MNRSISFLFSLILVSVFTFPANAQEEDPYSQFTDYLKRETRSYDRPVALLLDPETARFNAFIDNAYEQYNRIGDPDSYADWGDYSDEAYVERLNYIRTSLANMRNEFAIEALNDEAQLTYKIYEHFALLQIGLNQYRSMAYPITHRGGPHMDLPNYLINYFAINSRDEAQLYIDLMANIGDVFDQTIINVRSRADNGVVIPSFLIPVIINTCRETISGRPFDDSGLNSPLYEDFLRKLNAATGISAADKTILIASAETTLTNAVWFAYQDLIAYMSELTDLATDEAGVWKFPDGDAYYKMLLRYHTTTNLTADEIHVRGLRGVKDIHERMKRLMIRVNFGSDDLQDFFEFMRNDNQFYYPNTTQGRQNFLTDTRTILNTMQTQLPLYFTIVPRSRLEVRAVESYREKTAGSAFYSSGTRDGSRPGVYYVNLYDMKNQPKFEMKALAYHEGVPGHHYQIMRTRETNYATYFRSSVGFTAYIEGWALYCEHWPKWYGFYTDHYSDFGRLSMELWRACRLVVDTGLHSKRWSREQAINYLINNTPSSREACTDAIDRYIVLPGQATAYMIGKQKIIELQNRAIWWIRDDFKIRDFHEIIMKNGSLPLDLLQDIVYDWISERGYPDMAESSR